MSIYSLDVTHDYKIMIEAWKVSQELEGTIIFLNFVSYY